MEEAMGRRLVLLLVLLGLLPGVALGARTTSWAAAQIRALGQDPASFRPDETITRGELAELLVAAGLAPTPVAKPDVPVTMQDLDARLVAALGLQPAARAFADGAKAAGLAPPSRFGTEVVARFLGLRTNHPAANDALERLPTQPAPRAEAAFSAARILGFRGWELPTVKEAAATFVLPELTDWQRRVLTTAFKLVGFPYVWAGTANGFDCSGFVWRVYKLQPYPSSGPLAATLRGRTTYAMSGEVPKGKRLALEALQPADVIFFGSRGFRSKPAEVGHMGIYVGNGWFVHSSRYGVALERLEGWYREKFAWGRRPLAEADLT
jgi:cell wall-associated NlpC family hydrolase